MKKTLILALSTVITSAAFSQVQFGIKAGYNHANLKYENNSSVKTDPRSGYHAGFFTHIPVAGGFAIQPEVTYSLQGAEYEAPVLGKDKISYVNIPVLLQYQLKGGLRLQTGPQLGILTENEFEPANGGANSEIPNVNNLDFSWSAGLGYLSRIGLGVDLRYNHGISNIYESGNSNNEVKNRVLQIGLFYQFGK